MQWQSQSPLQLQTPLRSQWQSQWQSDGGSMGRRADRWAAGPEFESPWTAAPPWTSTSADFDHHFDHHHHHGLYGDRAADRPDAFWGEAVDALLQ